MSTRSFENLDFSILVEDDHRVAYLQQWDDGVWGEPHRFPLPVSGEDMQRLPVLSQAVKSFRRDGCFNELRDSLTHGAWRWSPEEPGWFARLWAAVQAPFRQIALFSPADE